MKKTILISIVILVLISVVIASYYVIYPSMSLGKIIVTTDKLKYNQGELIQIFIENKYNQLLKMGVENGCEGSAYVISKYDNDNWIDFPETCGMCEMEVNILLNPKEIKVFEWDQLVYTDWKDCSKKSKVDPGQYRIKIKYWMRGSSKTSYSSTIIIK